MSAPGHGGSGAVGMIRMDGSVGSVNYRRLVGVTAQPSFFTRNRLQPM
ncbi:hypothetical protein ACWDV4_28890 [Micromonospora sp. NPDC003197]